METREPKQERSKQKKDLIIKVGFDLICQNGYNNTNTKDIAENAHVSIGIVYQYFKDKHDIFIEGLKQYSDNIFYPIKNINITKNNLEKDIENLINNYIKNHKLTQKSHEEIMSMIHLDESVAQYYYKREINITEDIYNNLINNNFNKENLFEKVHIILGMIDNLCHEVVYHKHENLNYDIMKKEVIKEVVQILS